MRQKNSRAAAHPLSLSFMNDIPEAISTIEGPIALATKFLPEPVI